jgi:aspartyl-tRNA(Asn)/glutamyl-tRNA(Gln) amidotransferase subunit A
VRSNALVLNAISGIDKRDATSRKSEKISHSEIDKNINGLRVGVPYSAFNGVSADVRAATEAAIVTLSELGAEIKEIKLPDRDALLAAYYIISSAEASSNLARYDGVRYGRRSESAQSLDELLVKSRSEGFGDEVKRRIMLGTHALSRDARDAYYNRAQSLRRALARELERIFESCDACLMPTAPTVAYEFENKKQTPLEVYLEDALCVIANMAGLPSVSVPFGNGEGGMPVGIQLMGRDFDEGMLYRIAASLEAVRGGGGNE